MNRSIIVIAATLLPLPAVAAAQGPERATDARTVVVLDQPSTDARMTAGAEATGRQRPAQARRAAATQTERITRTLTVRERGEVLISNLAGDIVVTRGSGNEVRVEAIKTARGESEEDAREMLGLVQVVFSEHAGRAEVKSVYPSDRQHGRRNISVTVAYNVSAPEHVRLTLRSLSGDISLSDVKGDVSAVTTSGDVTIRNAGRIVAARSTSGDVQITDTNSELPFQAHTVSGNVIIRQVRAPRLELSTISGDVRLLQVETERVNAQSLSGNVEFASPLARNGRYSLKSHSGDVRIIVAGNAGFEIDANSFSGNVRSDVDLKNVVSAASTRGRARSLRGMFGDGSALIDVTTFSGNVTVVRR